VLSTDDDLIRVEALSLERVSDLSFFNADGFGVIEEAC
jgi:hypothetical protein